MFKDYSWPVLIKYIKLLDFYLKILNTRKIPWFFHIRVAFVDDTTTMLIFKNPDRWLSLSGCKKKSKVRNNHGYIMVCLIKYYKYIAKAETPRFYRFKIWRMPISRTIFLQFREFQIVFVESNIDGKYRSCVWFIQQWNRIGCYLIKTETPWLSRCEAWRMLLFVDRTYPVETTV